MGTLRNYSTLAGTRGGGYTEWLHINFYDTYRLHQYAEYCSMQIEQNLLLQTSRLSLTAKVFPVPCPSFEAPCRKTGPNCPKQQLSACIELSISKKGRCSMRESQIVTTPTRFKKLIFKLVTRADYLMHSVFQTILLYRNRLSWSG